MALSGCPDLGLPRTYRNARFGFQMDHPERFALDPGSVPEAGDSARFWTPDRRATAVVTCSFLESCWGWTCFGSYARCPAIHSRP